MQSCVSFASGSRLVQLTLVFRAIFPRWFLYCLACVVVGVTRRVLKRTPSSFRLPVYFSGGPRLPDSCTFLPVVCYSRTLPSLLLTNQIGLFQLFLLIPPIAWAVATTIMFL